MDERYNNIRAQLEKKFLILINRMSCSSKKPKFSSLEEKIFKSRGENVRLHLLSSITLLETVPIVPPSTRTLYLERRNLALAYAEAKADPAFQAQLGWYRQHFIGGPTPMYHAQRLSDEVGGAQVTCRFDREDREGSITGIVTWRISCGTVGGN